MTFHEQAISFQCHDAWLYGIISTPEQPTTRGLLIVVGGPQYRVGSHRQFTLLARHLASYDIPVMRFDVRGMGDSEGDIRSFEDIEEDLRSAIDQFFDKIPSLKELIIWGLCDAASAALFYAYKDQRVTGLVLLNPWARTEQGAIKTYLKHYYLTRLFQPEFWKKVRYGQYNPIATIHFLFRSVLTLMTKKETTTPPYDSPCTPCSPALLPDRMLDGLKRFTGRVFIITSGDDLTAQEFLDLINHSKNWQDTLKSKKTEYLHLQDANHTFASYEWRDEVATLTQKWVKSW